MTGGLLKRLGAILVLVGLIYVPVTTAFFCSYDDFLELHRAAFTDAPNLEIVFKTSHWQGARYRPLNRAFNVVTWRAGKGGALAFRLRDLASHLACVALVFLLSLALFSSGPAATWGALFFGLHPLANMTIVGAVNTNAFAHALLLSALLLFQRALRAPSAGAARAGAALVVGGLAILMYDAEVVLFPLLALLVLLEWRLSGRRPGRGVLAVGIGGSAILAGAYALLRSLYVPAGQVARSVAPLMTLAKSLATFGGALLLPLDPVLLHELFGTPFPSELARAGVPGRGLALFLLGFSTVAVLGLAVLAWRRVRPSWRSSKAPSVAFAACGFVILLLPLLVFTKHASETYVYLPVAFVSLLVGLALASAGRVAPRATFAVGAVVVVLAGAATLARNFAVARCGAAAEHLVKGLEEGAGKAPALLVANEPGSEKSRRYGFYGFRGTDTVGDGVFANLALSQAVQLSRRELGMTVAVVDPDVLRRASCAPPTERKPAFWAFADGSLAPCACDTSKEFR